MAQLEAEKQAELERIGQMTIAEAREVILTETENNLTHEIATRIKDAEAQIKDTVDKKAKTCWRKLCNVCLGTMLLNKP